MWLNHIALHVPHIIEEGAVTFMLMHTLENSELTWTSVQASQDLW